MAPPATFGSKEKVDEQLESSYWCLAKLRVLVGETGLVYTIGAILSRREVLPWPAS